MSVNVFIFSAKQFTFFPLKILKLFYFYNFGTSFSHFVKSLAFGLENLFQTSKTVDDTKKKTKGFVIYLILNHSKSKRIMQKPKRH